MRQQGKCGGGFQRWQAVPGLPVRPQHPWTPPAACCSHAGNGCCCRQGMRMGIARHQFNFKTLTITHGIQGVVLVRLGVY